MTKPTEQAELKPTMLYKAGDTVNPEAWNLKIDTKVVDASEVAEHKADGWLSADEVHEKLVEPKPTKAPKAAA